MAAATTSAIGSPALAGRSVISGPSELARRVNNVECRVTMRSAPESSPTSIWRRWSSAEPLVVKCPQENDVSLEARLASRREVFSLATLSVLLLSSDKAQARDIPLFGIRKQLEKAEKAVEGAEKAVEKEVKELARQGEKELESVSASVKEAVSDIEAEASVSPVLQAGGVLGAELVAVLVASTVVNGLVAVPLK